MKKSRLKLSVIAVAACVSVALNVNLPAEAASESRSSLLFKQSAYASPKWPKVSAGDFAAAKKLFGISKDEFDGTILAIPHVSRSNPRLFQTSSPLAAAGLSTIIEVDGAKKIFRLDTDYVGQTELKFDQVSLKSDKGTFALRVPPKSLLVEEFPEGVNEFATTALNNSSILAFCNLVKGKKVKARFEGTVVGTEWPVGYLTNLKQLRAGCTIWFGLQQGFRLKK